jgi:hypothetical protein
MKKVHAIGILVFLLTKVIFRKVNADISILKLQEILVKAQKPGVQLQSI